MKCPHGVGPTEMKKIEFQNVSLLVEPPVYSPREDSFLLAKAVNELAGGNVLDMGTGSGLQAIIAAQSQKVKQVTAVDASEKALVCAKQNAEKNHVQNKIKFVHSNLFENVEGKFDTIIFNPPYLPVEKREVRDDESMAWHGGEKGRDLLDPFLEQFPQFLSARGKLLLLQSSLNVQRKTLNTFKKLGFTTEIHSTQSFFFEKISVIVAKRHSKKCG